MGSGGIWGDGNVLGEAEETELWSDTIDGGSRVEISENAGDVIEGSILPVVDVRIGASRRETSLW